MRECRGALLIFTDDDVRLDEKWLTGYAAAAQAHPEADFFGGRILPLWPGSRPLWLRDEGMPLIGGLLVHYDRGEATRPLEDDDPLPFGASFALRRRLFKRLPSFRVDLGATGDVPGRGEEAEYLVRARAAGSRGVYVGSALCRHLVDPRRLRLAYLFRFGVQKGIAEVRTNGGETPQGLPSSAVGYLLRGLGQLVRGRGDRFRQCIINAGIQLGMKRERQMR